MLALLFNLPLLEELLSQLVKFFTPQTDIPDKHVISCAIPPIDDAIESKCDSKVTS